MNFLPIVDLELRQSSRRLRTYASRCAAAFLAVCVGLGLLSPSFWGVITPADAGRSLFQFVSYIAFGYALLVGVFATADSLSEEKRDGIMGLLFLTRMSAHEIVIGKLVARSLNFFYGLLAVLPIMGLSLLLGGVTSGEFWRMNLVILNAFFFSVALGICVSASSYDGRKAIGATVFLVALITFGPVFLAGGALKAAKSVASLFALLFSPAISSGLVPEADYLKFPELFWTSLLMQNLLNWALLFAAGCTLRSTWNYEPKPSRFERWAERLVFGDPANIARRWRLREQWLALNPVLWLARRERHEFRVLLPYFIVTLCVWLIGWFTINTFWRTAEVVLLTGAIVHTLLKYWIATEVSRRFSETRRNGVMELLLITPLTVAEVLQGMLATIKQQFLVPVIVALIGDVGLLYLGANAPTSSLGLNNLAPYLFAGMAMLVTDAYTLSWVGLWKAMSAKNPRWAFLQTFAFVMVAPWFVMLILTTLVLLLTGGEGFSAGWLVAFWFGAGYLTDMALCFIALNRLTNNFHELITENPRGFLERAGL